MTYVKSTNLFPYRHLVNLCIHITAVTKRQLYIPFENLGKPFIPIWECINITYLRDNKDYDVTFS
jgi:hypothetical protein